MKIWAEQLDAQLATPGRRLFWIAGDEPFLVGQCCTRIREYLRAEGCSDRSTLQADPQFDWSRLQEAASARSLFAPDALVELQLPNGKPGTRGAEVLSKIAGQIEHCNRLLIVGPRADKRSLGAKWATAVEQAGLLVQVGSIGREHLPKWVRAQLRGQGLDADQDALRIIADCAEGNLVAAHQEIAKLALQFPNQQLNAEQVRASIADGSRFRGFDVVDAALAGDPERVVHSLQRLREEGEAPPQLLWALANDIRKLLKIRIALDRGQPRARVLADNQVWKQRERLVLAALRRHDEPGCKDMLRAAAAVDRCIKGLQGDDPWSALEVLALRLAGSDPLPARGRSPA